jgi:hypothetical protein
MHYKTFTLADEGVLDVLVGTDGTFQSGYILQLADKLQGFQSLPSFI